MNWENFQKIIETEPAYRKKQAAKAIFHDLVESWEEVSTLPKNLREKLQENVELPIEAKKYPAKDGRTIKAAIQLPDGNIIETVLMKHTDKRNTICVSSQVGCPLGCVFCATGKMGFVRNLSAMEIVEQVLLFARDLKKSGEKVTNVVFMGMGEPFLNWEQVSEAIKILNDPNYFGIGARKISVSTSGITEGIEKLIREFPQVNLAISLHAPNDKLRGEMMPINQKYPLKNVMAAVDDYVKKTNRKVMFEYVMIRDVNDSESDARELSKLMKKPLYMVNLIACNPTGEFRPSSPEKIKKFKSILEKAGVFATQRYRFGTDINAACGQLAGESG